MYGHADVIPQATVDSLRAQAVAMAKDAGLVVFIGGLNKNTSKTAKVATALNTDFPSDNLNLSTNFRL